MPDRKVTVYIKDLNLSQRNTNALLRNGIVTLNQLENCDMDELAAIRGLGKDSIKEIDNILNKKDEIFKSFENRMELIETIPEDICNIAISELGLSDYTFI